MNRKGRRATLWVALIGILAVTGAIVPLWVMADSSQSDLTATLYADVIRFDADGAASLRLTIYDLAENELWSSGLIPGDFVDWDRTNERGERLANGYYLYLAQGWDGSETLVLNKAGRVVLLPGDQVELKTAPTVSGAPADSFGGEPVYGPLAYDETNFYISNRLGVGTDTPAYEVDVAGYVRSEKLMCTDATPQMRWYESDAADDPSDYMRHEYGGNKYRMQWRDDSAGTWFNALVADGTNRFVGIGTTAPTKTLDVAGTGRFTGALTVGNYTLPTAAGTNGQVLTTNGAGAASWQNAAAGGSFWVASGNDISNTNSGEVEVDTGSFRVSDPSSIVELLLQSTGGTWSWNVMSEGDCHLYNDTNSRFVLYAEASGGDVGVGTTVPAAKLHVNGTGRYDIGGGQINMSTPGGWPGLIMYEPNAGHRRDLIIWNEGISLEVSSTASAPPAGNGITIRESGNVGIGTTAPGAPLTVVGNVRVRNAADSATVVEIGEGLDYAEGFDVSDIGGASPGSVLVIDADNPGHLTVSRVAYDRKVAGIVAGANALGSGVRLGGEQFDQDVALAGRVYCNVDTSYGAIAPGDLLTTSSTPGFAMKVADYVQAQGAILGKAMEGLGAGQTGQILVLVTLQ